MSSFNKINYNLRPAKAVERKMLSFALKKLGHFGSLSSYQYIGFGATTFHDFILFHKELGIHKMISIELSGNQDRFRFNKPFHCIEMKFGDSQTILPSINWRIKTILWLDYDKTLQRKYLNDISTFFSSAASGSTFLISLNCDPSSYGDENVKRRAKIIEEIGEDNLTFGNKLIDFSSNNLSLTLYNIIKNQINTTLISRNGGLEEGSKYLYEQLFHFQYADGAKMLTVGGVLINSEDQAAFDSAKLEEHTFVRKSEDVFKIDIPILTLKEIRFLNSHLPNGIDNNGLILSSELIASESPNLRASDILKYSNIYSFFPFYTEAFSI